MEPPCVMRLSRSEVQMGCHEHGLSAGASMAPPLWQVGAIRDRSIGNHVDVEGHRRFARSANFDPMWPGLEVDVLKHAVEVVDDANVVAVDEHLCIARRVRDA